MSLHPAAVDHAPFLAALAAAIRGDVAADLTARATHSMDASNYRHVPVAVVYPRDAADVAAVLKACRAHGVPVTARGAGTSIGGQSVGDGIVLEFRRYMNAILSIDRDARRATVQPGVVLDRLREAAAAHGLTFGPDPSTHSRCTIGGMIGNDSCGSHSLAWGRMSDNVIGLKVLTPDGSELTIGGRAGVPGTGGTTSAGTPERISGTGRAAEITSALNDFVGHNLPTLRTGFPGLPRRNSGFSLDKLLPEHGFDLAGALVGTEGTCVIVTEATVRLVPRPAARVLLIAGYADDIAAADAVPAVLPDKPLTVEGIAQDLVDALLAQGRRHPALDRLPAGGGWLFIEFGGATAAEAIGRATATAQKLAAHTGATTVIAEDAGDQAELWSIREAAAGIVTRLPDGSEAWPGWEDAAVPPDRLGPYLRGFRDLLARHRLHGVPYGHFGEGCVHARIDFALTTAAGRVAFRKFLEEAADLVAAHGGSLSGEHGDGQARAELLPRMYAPEVIALFEEFKLIWDPGDLLNPGNLVRPRKLDTDLRFDGPVMPLKATLLFPRDQGSLAQAARRCVGVGKCLDTTTGVMCPSYMVTGKEEYSTRGRARLLHEMMRGDTVTDGWRSKEVHDALDLCLACKGCLSDCPVNVDMASYKAEFMSHYYQGRLRPAAHYTLGNLPLAARAASRAPGLVNRVLAAPGVSAALKRIAGIAEQRQLPRFAPRTLRQVFRPGPETGRPKVLLWPDTFTNYFSPEIGLAAVRVLEHAGFDVRLPGGSVCCGLTWMSTGQLGMARRMLRRTVRVLEPHLTAGTPVVGLEPSCLAVFRHDATDLLPFGELNGLPENSFTLAEFLERFAPDVAFPPVPARAIIQQHCHQHAVMGNAADERVLAKAGVANRTMDSGCCGLAGNFGVERGHYDVSVAVANRVMVPEINSAGDQTLVLADGFSCRTQISELTGRKPLHLAQVLARALAGHDADSTGPGRPHG